MTIRNVQMDCWRDIGKFSAKNFPERNHHCHCNRGSWRQTGQCWISGFKARRQKAGWRYGRTKILSYPGKSRLFMTEQVWLRWALGCGETYLVKEQFLEDAQGKDSAAGV